jgi:hypothetical protein
VDKQFWQLTNDQKGWIYSSDEFLNQQATAADFWESASEDYKFWILAGGMRCIQQDSEGNMCGRFHAPTTCPNFGEVSRGN